jgi:hypothetical protein
LALGTNGWGLGCARITPEGRIERMAVLPHECRTQIEKALIEILNTYFRESRTEKQRLQRAGSYSQTSGQDI